MAKFKNISRTRIPYTLPSGNMVYALAGEIFTPEWVNPAYTTRGLIQEVAEVVEVAELVEAVEKPKKEKKEKES